MISAKTILMGGGSVPESTLSVLETLMSAVEQLRSDFLAAAPNLVKGLSIFGASLLVAWLVRWSSIVLVKAILRLSPNGADAKATSWRETLSTFSRLVGNLAFFVVLILGTATAFKRAGLVVVSTWLEEVSRSLPGFVGAMVIFYFGWRAKDLLADLIYQALSRARLHQARLASRILAWFAFALATLVALEQVGINVDLIVVVLGIAVGLSVGGLVLTMALGARDTIGDVLYCHQLKRVLHEGDTVEVSGHSGRVEAIGPLFVLLSTEQGKVSIAGGRFTELIPLIKGERVG